MAAVNSRSVAELEHEAGKWAFSPGLETKALDIAVWPGNPMPYGWCRRVNPSFPSPPASGETSMASWTCW